MLDKLRARPWILIVLFLACAVAANLVFVAISVMHPPVPV